MSSAAEPPEGPFRPRLRPRAFLRRLKPERGPPGGFDLLALASFLFVLFGFWRLFVIMRAQDAAGGSGAALGTGGSATTWLVLTAGAAGILAYALHRSREPSITWKRRPKKR